MKRVLLAAAVLATGAAIFIWARLPPKRQTLSATFSDGTVAGVLHVHSNRSDGRGTPEQIAHEAAKAGLTFVVITDHGDASHLPDAPVYREGVLVLDGTEISTSGGHYITIDMPAAPYPLGGDSRDVVEDVKRLGGFGIVAHPDSPKPQLRWREWTAPFDAIEILNLDTSWRRRVTGTTWRPKAGLLTRLLTYPIRPVESITSLIGRSEIFHRWDALSRRRHLVTLGGTDAHAQVDLNARLSVSVPSYESSFRAMSLHVRTAAPLTGTAATDAAMLMRAIRAGHLYTVVDGAATPPAFEFTATNGHGTVSAGDQLTLSGPVTLHVRSNAPDGYTTTIWNGVTAVASDRTERDITVTAPEGPATYWVEIRASGALSGVPWITSNAIYVRSAEPSPPLPVRPPSKSSQLLSSAAWDAVADPTSLAATDVVPQLGGEQARRLRFGLADGAPHNQYAALRVATPQGLAGRSRVSFEARAEHPMRISVQLQSVKGRWQRSIYVDTMNQPHTIFLDDFTPVGETETYGAPPAEVRNILFVIDTVNTKPGASGRLWITKPAIEE